MSKVRVFYGHEAQVQPHGPSKSAPVGAPETLVGVLEDAKAPTGAPEVPEGAPSDEWTVVQLEAWADAHNVELPPYGRKADKLDAIQAALASEEG